MRILITNDDGYRAEGINTLFRVLSERHEVVMIAPDGERSACSNAITITSNLRLRCHGEGIWSVSGYPADCTNIGLHGTVAPKADLVISGINHGPNMGDDIYYSGTVAGARAAFIQGTRAIAVSYDSFESYAYLEDAARFVMALAEEKCATEERFFLNVNYPDLPKEKIAGVCYTTLGRRRYIDAYHVLERDGHDTHLKLHGTVDSFDRAGSDVTEIKSGHITVTPLTLDTTDYPYLERMGK